MWILNKLISWSKKKQVFESSSNFSISSLISWFSEEVTDEELLWLYKGWVFAACDSIWDWLAWTKRVVFKDKEEQEIIEHKYWEIFDYNMIKAIAIFLKTLWVVHIYKEKIWNRVVWLKLLNSLFVLPRKNELWDVTWYWYSTWKWYFIFAKDDILEIKTFSPIFADKWMTPLKAVASQVATDLASIEFNKMFFENGWKPGTIIKHTWEIDDDVKDKYIAKFKNDFMWIKNSHKVMFADRWIELESLNVSQKDMEVVWQRQFTMEEVLMVFRVWKPILWKSDWVWFADRKVPWHYLNEYTLKPLATQIQETINNDKDLFKDTWFLSFQFPIDKEELMQEFQANLITRNQYLIATWKLPFKNWNVFWDWTEAEEVEEKKDIKLSSKLEKSLESVLINKEKQSVFGTEEYNQKIWNTKIARTDLYEKEFEAIQKKIWNIQQREITKQLEWQKEITKALKESDLIPEKKSVLQYLTMFTPFFNKFMTKEWEITIAEISDEEFSISKTNVWIGERIEKMSKDIDEVTRKEMFLIIKQWNRDKIWTSQIVANINKQFSLYTKKKWRVENISRTEITRASNKSQVEAFRQSWVVEKKQWFTSIDERRCEYCAWLHWKTIKLWDSFLKLWDKQLWQVIKYETVDFPPRHPRCRCVARPIIDVKAMKRVQEIMLKKWITLIINK